MKPVPVIELKRRGIGTALALVGFLLSPLSWWNDLFVNVPLALAFAWIVSWCYPPAFTAAFVTGYWLTNVLGLVFMQRGAELAISSKLRPYTSRQVARDLLIALAYTALILVLVKMEIFGPLPGFHR